jgi:hypothetical protein
MTYARRTDSSHAEVRDTLRKLGCRVEDCSWIGRGWPDLMVRLPGRDWAAIEVKSAKGKLKQAQEQWRDRMGMRYVVLRSAEEAVQWWREEAA